MSTIDTLNNSLDNMVNIQNVNPLLLISIIGFIAGIKIFLNGGWYRYLGGILIICSGFTLLISVSPAFRNSLI